MAVLLALMSAVMYGTSDYVGGRASRRFTPIAISWLSEVTMLVGFAVAVPLLADSGPTAGAVGWGALAGFAGSLGVLGLYTALSRGNMTVVAPITGVVAAAIPVAVGIGLGERPGWLVAAGIALAVAAVALVGGIVGVIHAPVGAPTVLLAVLVGGGFGLLFVALAEAGESGALWPLLTVRLGGVPLLGVAFVVGRRRGAVAPVSRHVARPALAMGVMIGLANACYLLSTQGGLLSVVAVIVSLYPASTILLAVTLDRERAARSQVAGMLLAAVAVGAITLGS